MPSGALNPVATVTYARESSGLLKVSVPLGALGRRFESCRPDPVTARVLGGSGSPLFSPKRGNVRKMYEWQAPLAVHGARLGPLYERCTNGAGVLQNECFAQVLAGLANRKTPLPASAEIGALDLAAELSPFQGGGAIEPSLRSSPRCIAPGDRALANWRKGTCAANGPQA